MGDADELMKPRSASSRFVAWTGGLTALVGLALLGWVLSSLSELHRTLAEISAPLANAVLIALIVVLVAILSLGLRFLWVAARAGDRTAETQSPGGARARGAAYASVAPVQAFAAGYASRVIGEATKVYLRNGASWGPAGPKTVIQSILDTLDKDSIMQRIKAELHTRLRTG